MLSLGATTFPQDEQAERLGRSSDPPSRQRISATPAVEPDAAPISEPTMATTTVSALIPSAHSRGTSEQVSNAMMLRMRSPSRAIHVVFGFGVLEDTC